MIKLSEKKQKAYTIIPNHLSFSFFVNKQKVSIFLNCGIVFSWHAQLNHTTAIILLH